MTADEFRKLPLLLRAADVMAVTGWNKATLRKEAESVPELCYRMKSGHRRYRKTVVAMVVGWRW